MVWSGVTGREKRNPGTGVASDFFGVVLKLKPAAGLVPGILRSANKLSAVGGELEARCAEGEVAETFLPLEVVP